MLYLAKTGEPPKPSNLLEGAIVINHHVYHIGTSVPSSSFSVLHPQPWLICQQGFSSVLTCPVNSSPIAMASVTV